MEKHDSNGSPLVCDPTGELSVLRSKYQLLMRMVFGILVLWARRQKAFKLADRGRIVRGARADLGLVDGNQLKDIKATQAIVRVLRMVSMPAGNRRR